MSQVLINIDSDRYSRVSIFDVPRGHELKIVRDEDGVRRLVIGTSIIYFYEAGFDREQVE